MKAKGICILALLSGLLCGCSANELEDRCFPMLAIVDANEGTKQVAFCDTFPTPRRSEDQGETTQTVDTEFSHGIDFADARARYESQLDKKPDYHHLKVLLIGKNFMEEKEQYNGMLDVLQEQEDFPRNVYVCVVEDVEAVVELAPELSDDAGSYFENFIKNHSEEHGNIEVTLGMLMDEQENQSMELELPYLRVEKSRIVWEVNYCLPVEQAQKSLSQE